MKVLTLLRHAKAGLSEASLKDVDKPLSEQGIQDALKMGAVLVEEGFKPDVVVCSSALRAVTTANNVLSKVGIPEAQLKIDARVYNASTSELMDVVKSFDKYGAEHVMMIGHNPGFSILCNQILNGASVELHTCDLVQLHLELDKWSTCEIGCGRLEKLIQKPDQ